MAWLWRSPVFAYDAEIEFWKEKERKAAFTVPTTFFCWQDSAKAKVLDPDKVTPTEKKDCLNFLASIAFRCAQAVGPLWFSGEGLSWFAKKGIPIDKLTPLQNSALKMMYAQRALNKDDLDQIHALLESVGGLTSLDAAVDAYSGTWRKQYVLPGWRFFDIDRFTPPQGATNQTDPGYCPLWLTLYELLKFAEAFKMLSIISSGVRKQKVTQKDWDYLGPYLPMYSPEDRMHARFNPANPNERVRGTIGIAFARFADFINLELSRINLFMPRYDVFGFSPYSENEWSAAVQDIQTNGSFFPGIRMNFPDVKSILWHWFATTTLGKSDMAICADCERFFTRKSTGRPAKFCSRRCEHRTRQRKYQQHRKAKEKVQA